MKNYKTPILSSIFNVLGIIVLVAAVLWIVIGIIIAGESRSMLALFPTIGAVLMLGLVAMIYFGVAQVIDYLGRTAHSTNRILHIFETTLSQQIHSIEQRVNSSNPILVRMDKVSTAAPSSEGTRAGIYYYAIDGNQEGPFRADDIKEFRRSGVISDDTQIYCEGDSKWRPYKDFPEIDES